MNPIVRVENVSKQYRLGGHEARYQTLRDSIMSLIRQPFTGSRNDKTNRKSEMIWALKDISFEIATGEVVGIIGRNGAGKSTLLKVLSRITEPTSGRVELYGRVASLLEVGTGFHPELTGKENIYLNGSILGLRRAEIERKFDEIVWFAEIETFLDTPVKHYSSGMYMRLAFAVAAHLEPEILIVDEVLSVGDAPFQKKCIGKMGDVARAGRTVLFVSHNLGAVTQLCSRGIILKNGKTVFDGEASAAVSTYVEEMRTSSTSSVTFEDEPNKDMQILSMGIVSPDGEVISSQPHTEPFSILIKYRVNNWAVGAYVCMDVFTESGTRLLWGSDVTTIDDLSVERQSGIYTARVTIPDMVLTPGFYYFTSGIYAPGSMIVFDHREAAVSIEILDGGSLLSNFGIKPHAATMIPLHWETLEVEHPA
ncbi:MAG TPA: ABC transporter ATP-binding protein [Pyrinomonadaceae bacterium]|jgi:lipopolysaccharide transport system ATP-binding protein|nr:ABC transporter ATP-binding protein [Pyrinomonadaceae bacterium]